MEQEYDFNRVGKRMPYSVPDGFFESLEENVMREVGAELPSSALSEQAGRRTRPVNWLTRGAAAAAIAGIVAFGGYKLAFKANATDSFAAVEQAFDNLNEEDQEFLLEVYQDDYFIADEIAEEDI